MSISICNMTASFNLGKEICLQDFVEANHEARMSRGGFDQVIWKMSSVECTALLYRSGKVVLVGSKSRKLCKGIAKQMRKTIGDGNEDLCKVKFTNFVGSAALGYETNVIRFIAWCERQVHTIFPHMSDVMYAPELFPGCKITVPGINSTAVLFRSGKYFITGCKTKAEVLESNEFINHLTNEYLNYCVFDCQHKIGCC